MTINISQEKWLPCLSPAVADTLRWREPLWATPTKPRGRPDKIGEQMVTAKVIVLGEPAELQVIDVQRLSLRLSMNITAALIEQAAQYAQD